MVLVGVGRVMFIISCMMWWGVWNCLFCLAEVILDSRYLYRLFLVLWLFILSLLMSCIVWLSRWGVEIIKVVFFMWLVKVVFFGASCFI